MLSANTRGVIQSDLFLKQSIVYMFWNQFKVHRCLHPPSWMSPILKEQLMYKNLTVMEACGDLLELIKNYVTQHSLNLAGIVIC